MGAVVANTMVTLNGVAGRPETWQFDYASPQMMGLMADSLGSSAGLLLGRRTYQEFACYWPHVGAAENPLASAMNELPKHVVSATLAQLEWSNSTLVPGEDAASRIAALRSQVDGDLSILGSPTLVRTMLEAGLVDRLALLVCPVVVEDDTRLFDRATARTPLTLLDCAELPHGVLQLTYAPTGHAAGTALAQGSGR